MPKITVEIPPSVKKILDQRREQTGRSMTWYVVKALVAYFRVQA